ncbi:hypothetical protein RGI145_03470 [Roseomonas gilardii]|uniref:Uncharacterized protein n=1 Tax=Roseomonas gilardii TaxID=257708 RepID=A0A1L7ABY7_9PROT|nr:hypothetical protein RGI145_03470 [Roseomonas gilardii]
MSRACCQGRRDRFLASMPHRALHLRHTIWTEIGWGKDTSQERARQLPAACARPPMIREG